MKGGWNFAVILALGLTATAVCAQDQLSDWRAFRGNDGSATSTEKGLPLTWNATENMLWRTDLPGAGSSTPIIVGPRVFVTCYSGYNVPGQARGRQEDLKLHLVCLGRSQGNLLWKRDLPPKLPEQETIRDGHGYASSSPVADEARVFAFFGKSGVWAFDHDGKELWHADVGSNLHGWGSGASLLLAGGLVIVNASVESETLYALDAKTGKEVWRLGGIREAWNTPILARNGDQTELVIAVFGKVLGIDPKTGKELWNCATDIPWYMVPSLVAHEGVVYAIGGRPGGGLAVRLGGKGDVTRSHRLWISTKGGNVSSPVYHDGHLYWMHDNLGLAYCADARTGAIIYEERIARAGQVYGSPVQADGRIYYPSRGGAVYVVAARPRFELLASNAWGERGTYNASPAIAGRQLFFRTDRFVCCVGTK
jgi:outer membrane protein assembly factor BamB